ncbi:MAG: hypothetical protein DSZ21_02775 [Tenericutes bacterium]|nr:MAG: hypothetical protein DSZ21_02775 [Mycoplasmatota bacterium]
MLNDFSGIRDINERVNGIMNIPFKYLNSPFRRVESANIFQRGLKNRTIKKSININTNCVCLSTLPLRFQ